MAPSVGGGSDPKLENRLCVVLVFIGSAALVEGVPATPFYPFASGIFKLPTTTRCSNVAVPAGAALLYGPAGAGLGKVTTPAGSHFVEWRRGPQGSYAGYVTAGDMGRPGGPVHDPGNSQCGGRFR